MPTCSGVPSSFPRNTPLPALAWANRVPSRMSGGCCTRCADVKPPGLSRQGGQQIAQAEFIPACAGPGCRSAWVGWRVSIGRLPAGLARHRPRGVGGGSLSRRQRFAAVPPTIARGRKGHSHTKSRLRGCAGAVYTGHGNTSGSTLRGVSERDACDIRRSVLEQCL